MKKILSLLFTAMLIVAFCCGCQGGGMGTSDSVPDLPQSDSTQPSNPSDGRDEGGQDDSENDGGENQNPSTSDEDSGWFKDFV